MSLHPQMLHSFYKTRDASLQRNDSTIITLVPVKPFTLHLAVISFNLELSSYSFPSFVYLTF